MRIYIFRILTMIHLNTFSRVCPHSRGNNATEWDSVRIWRKDLSSTGIIPVEMPDFRTRHPGQVTTVENLSREARTRVRAVVCLYRRPANWPPRLYHYRMWLMWRLTQPLRLVIIIALGNRASPSILNRVLSERNALSTESTWPPGPNAPSSLSLSLSRSLPRFFTDLWTRWFIHSVNRGAVGRFRLLFLGLQGEREEKGGTCPRLGCAWIAGSGGPCWFSTKSTAPKMGPIVLLATNRWLHGPHEVVKSVSSQSNHVSGVGTKE